MEMKEDKGQETISKKTVKRKEVSAEKKKVNIEQNIEHKKKVFEKNKRIKTSVQGEEKTRRKQEDEKFKHKKAVEGKQKRSVKKKSVLPAPVEESKETEKKKVVRKKKEPKKHIVVFKDAQGKMLSTTFVNDGEAALAPELPEILEEKQHYRVVFQGWDQEILNVHSNLVVSPVYKEIPKEYLIMYFHENGKILGTETVIYGQDAKKEFHLTKPETEKYRYHFEGWNCDLTKIEKDQMAKAVFREEIKAFPIRFYNWDDTLLKTEQILYGQTAHAPENVKKEEDFTFRYHFQGWDQDFTSITGPLEVKALFQKEYIDYTVRFFEEEKCVEEYTCHYQDAIEFPKLHKKGYDIVWDKEIKYVEESMDIFGEWHFSNPKGKRIECSSGVYEILNPSISHGSVCCLEYYSEEKLIELPSRIKLGDFYYNLESIGPKAFFRCPNMRKLVCPDSVKVLERESLKGCVKLESIVFGKNLTMMGAFMFSGCDHLSSIIFKGKRMRQIRKDSFEKMVRNVRVYVKAEQYESMKKVFQEGIRKKGIEICLLK